jgi:hypothetical protein
LRIKAFASRVSHAPIPPLETLLQETSKPLLPLGLSS